jgi:hypothetical protein
VKTADPNHIDPELEGQLVRLEGMAIPQGEVVDPDLGVRTSSGLLLARTVEMWQWLETKPEAESETTESEIEAGSKSATQPETQAQPEAQPEDETVYEQGWSDAMVDSDAFEVPEGHENPDEPRLPPLTVTTTVKVGEFVMPDKQVRSIQKREPLPATSLDSVPEELQPAVVHDGMIFVGNDPDAPQVGDLRVKYETVEPLYVRLLGVQRGDTLTHFGNDKNPRFLVMKIEDQLLFPYLDSISPVQIWLYRGAAFAGLLFGLGLLRRALPERLRPGIGALAALALAAAFGTAVSPWLDVSGLHAWSFAGVAAFSAVSALLLIRRT